MKIYIYLFILVVLKSVNLAFGQNKPVIFHTHTFVEMDIDKDLLTKKYVLGTISLDLAKNTIVIKANNLEDNYTIIEVVKHTKEGDNLYLSFECLNKKYIRIDIKDKHAVRIMVFSKPIPDDPTNYKAIKSYINFEINKPLEAMGDF